MMIHEIKLNEKQNKTTNEQKINNEKNKNNETGFFVKSNFQPLEVAVATYLA